MIEVDDHNAARWLAVRYLARPRGLLRERDNEPIPGWYVVRTCPCHRDERVCRYPYPDEDAANAVHELLVKVGQQNAAL